jgi:hypothetical protein
MPADGKKVEINVPRVIALPLCAAQLYFNFKGSVIPHELLRAVEEHIRSPDTTLDGTERGLIQKWLIVAAQKDGVTPTSKSWIAFASSALLSNEEPIHRWISDRMDSTLGRRAEPSSGVGGSGVQGNNIAAMGNLSGVIASEVGHGLGVAMKQATQAATNTGTGRSGLSSKYAKPNTQDQLATLLGFHGAMNVTHFKKVWQESMAAIQINKGAQLRLYAPGHQG